MGYTSFLCDNQDTCIFGYVFSRKLWWTHATPVQPLDAAITIRIHTTVSAGVSKEDTAVMPFRRGFTLRLEQMSIGAVCW